MKALAHLTHEIASNFRELNLSCFVGASCPKRARNDGERGADSDGFVTPFVIARNFGGVAIVAGNGAVSQNDKAISAPY